jgi:hypothetical protein
MSNAVLLHQLQVLENQRNASGASPSTGKRKRTSTAASLTGGVNRKGGEDGKNKKSGSGEDVRGKRFKAALEQLAAQGAPPNKGRGRQKKHGMQKADALVAATRKANQRQQADRTRPNLRHLLSTDKAATKLGKPLVKSVISLGGRGLRKKKERKWHIQKDDNKLHDVPKW